MNSPNNNAQSTDRLEALFQQREAEFREEIYKSWAMAERNETYNSIQKIAIALIEQSVPLAVLNEEKFPNTVVTRAIAIHEQIEHYCAKKELRKELRQQEQPNAEQLPEQND